MTTCIDNAESMHSMHSSRSNQLSITHSSSSSSSSTASSVSIDSTLRVPSITGLSQLKSITSNQLHNMNSNVNKYTNEIFHTNGQLYNLSNSIQPIDQWQFNYASQQQSSHHPLFCGPGRKRYLIAFLCCACLTVVIGMRSEMLGIITNLNNTHSRITLGFKYPMNNHYNDDELHNMHYSNRTNKFNADVNQLNAIQSNVDKHTNNNNNNDDNLDENDNLQLNSHHLLHNNRRYSTALIFKPSEHRKMPWTETIKNDLVENAVFFAYLITSPIGGYLTVNYDSSFLLGSSVAITCGMNLFLPLVETIGNNINAKLIMIILLRLIQGLAEGCLIPAVFGILRYWSPENERSTLVCLAVIGVSLGPLIGLPVCAEIEKKWGWGVVFYIYANLGLIWCIFWWRLIDEKPIKDKKLNKHELHYLQTTIPKRILYNDGNTQIPWHKIFTSRPVYAILFTYAADDWTFQISSVCMQSFYQQIYNVDVERTIFFLSFPFLSRSMFVPIGGIFADFLRINTSLSLTTIRKMFAGLGFGLKGIFFIALGYAPSELYATMLLSLALGFSGLAVAGYAVNVIDLAPNFSGLVMGFANSVSTFTGILSTFIASVVVHKFGLELKNGWRVALCLAAFSQFIAMITYLLFSSSDQQSWAYSSTTQNNETDDDDDDSHHHYHHHHQHHHEDHNDMNKSMNEINNRMI